jgi:hypothetical protein
MRHNRDSDRDSGDAIGHGQLLHLIDTAARDELFDVRESFPAFKAERDRVERVAANARTADRCLRELDRICRTSVSGQRARVSYRLQIRRLRQWLLASLANDRLERRAAWRPVKRDRRAVRLRELLQQVRRAGVRREAAILLIAERWCRVWTREAGPLSPKAYAELWGRTIRPSTPHDRRVELLNTQFTRLLSRYRTKAGPLSR